MASPSGSSGNQIASLSRSSPLKFTEMPPANPVYLDHAATTPVREEVFEAMKPFFGPRFGNPSSTHRWGREARAALDEARERVGRCLGARPDEICFTSGGTEADNLAILGAWRALKAKGRTAVVTTPIEHKAILGAVHQAALRRRRRAHARDDRRWRDRSCVVRRARRRRGRRLLHDVGQQRDRLDSADSGARGEGEAARGSLPHRRRAGIRKDSDRRPEAAVRLPHDLGTQVRRAEGNRRALHSPRDPARAVDARRDAGSRSPARHGERRRGGRTRACRRAGGGGA